MLTTFHDVALRKESVDRNHDSFAASFHAAPVALRKESVDRNSTALASMRVSITIVALRKESVDRNYKERPGQKARPSRSPQGERG